MRRKTQGIPEYAARIAGKFTQVCANKTASTQPPFGASHPHKLALAAGALFGGVFLPAWGRASRAPAIEGRRVSASSWQEAVVPPA